MHIGNVCQIQKEFYAYISVLLKYIVLNIGAKRHSFFKFKFSPVSKTFYLQ